MTNAKQARLIFQMVGGSCLSLDGTVDELRTHHDSIASNPHPGMSVFMLSCAGQIEPGLSARDRIAVSRQHIASMELIVWEAK